MEPQSPNFIEGWSFCMLLKGHSTQLEFYIRDSEIDHIERSVQLEEEQEFVVFSSVTHRVAIRLEELVYCDFLSDFLPPHYETDDDELEDSEVGSLVCFRGSPTAIALDLEGDKDAVHSEQEQGAIGTVFHSLELGGDDFERSILNGSDGKAIFLRRGDIAMIQVDLALLGANADRGD